MDAGRRVGAICALADRIKEQAAAAGRAGRLTLAVLARELAPQDPTDEPAWVTLGKAKVAVRGDCLPERPCATVYTCAHQGQLSSRPKDAWPKALLPVLSYHRASATASMPDSMLELVVVAAPPVGVLPGAMAPAGPLPLPDPQPASKAAALNDPIIQRNAEYRMDSIPFTSYWGWPAPATPGVLVRLWPRPCWRLD